MPQTAEQIAADQIHQNWRDARPRVNGGPEPRWKPLNQASIDWLRDHPVPAAALRTVTVDGQQVQQIDIAALTNSQLPPQHSQENTAAATQAIAAIRANPNATREELAAIVHQDWIRRNDSWLPANSPLRAPYADLPPNEQAKDLAVVDVAQGAIAQAARQQQTALDPTNIFAAIPGMDAVIKAGTSLVQTGVTTLNKIGEQAVVAGTNVVKAVVKAATEPER